MGGGTSLSSTLNSKANDSDVVHKSGDETINGTKTFTSDTNTTYSLSSLGIGNVKNYDQSKAIKAVSRSGTTFTGDLVGTVDGNVTGMLKMYY